uniref:Protein kinase domain-containing protein n=1 Tax=Meloidogyne enterolobii TaxID=390850 RepID=A0A6V7TW14_MELEN|nr:unnamed protein product [Meloidogyne enterolobii]
MKHANVAKQLRRILISAAEALEQFHERGFVHLDIKSENFVSTHERDQNNNSIFKLIDFGTSEFMENQDFKVLSNEVLGTDVYMAPEINVESSTVWVNLFSICI